MAVQTLLELQPWMLLVLPVFFGLGWLAARMDIKQLLAKNQGVPASYFQGLNFLLNEQQDKAIESFLEVMKVDPQTIELHFALGSLFRRRGEVDRALRMHHNLVERADLDKARRQQAVFELAQDYLKAGILDRAELLFCELDGSPYSKQSLAFLLELYQKEHDWQLAIDVAHRLVKLGHAQSQKLIGFFYTELAVESAAQQDWVSANRYLECALSAFPNLVRAIILQGDYAKLSGQSEQALAYWQQLEWLAPDYLSQVTGRIQLVYAELAREAETLPLFRRYLQCCPSLDLMHVTYDVVLKHEGVSAAYELVRGYLQSHPTLLGLERLLDARLLDVSDERRADIEMVRELVHKWAKFVANYHCVHCGFKARQFYWHCPACQAWDSYSPKRDEEIGLTI